MADDKWNEEKKMPLRMIERAGGGLPLEITGWICGEPLFLLRCLLLSRELALDRAKVKEMLWYHTYLVW
jgi:hypothetical protein